MKEKRVQIVEVDGEHLTDFFRGNFTVIEGLPDDATLERTWEEPARHTYCFMFESEEFPVVEEGKEPPRTNIVTVKRRVNQSTHWVCQECHNTLDNGDLRK